MKRVLVSSLAAHEIEEAASFYETRKEGLGSEFTDRVAETLDDIERSPEIFMVVYRGLRRAPLRQFKEWGLFFRVLEDNSIVVACLSGKRSPSVMHERAGQPRLEP